MNKYALGTIVGTALLGLAKKGSKSEDTRLKITQEYILSFSGILRIPSDSSAGRVDKWLEDSIEEKFKEIFLGFGKRHNQELVNFLPIIKIYQVDVEEKGFEHDEDQSIDFQQISEQDSEERDERWNEWEDNRDILMYFEANIRFGILPKDLSNFDWREVDWREENPSMFVGNKAT